jgi:hypothetical protein
MGKDIKLVRFSQEPLTTRQTWPAPNPNVGDWNRALDFTAERTEKSTLEIAELNYFNPYSFWPSLEYLAKIIEQKKMLKDSGLKGRRAIFSGSGIWMPVDLERVNSSVDSSGLSGFIEKDRVQSCVNELLETPDASLVYGRFVDFVGLQSDGCSYNSLSLATLGTIETVGNGKARITEVKLAQSDPVYVLAEGLEVLPLSQVLSIGKVSADYRL